MKIELLYFDGCPNAQPAKKLITETIDELGLSTKFETINITDHDSAVCNRFLGSPSIRVNGKDLEIEEADDTQYSMRCRMYKTNSGQSGIPSKESLKSALSNQVT